MQGGGFLPVLIFGHFSEIIGQKSQKNGQKSKPIAARCPPSVVFIADNHRSGGNKYCYISEIYCNNSENYCNKSFRPIVRRLSAACIQGCNPSLFLQQRQKLFIPDSCYHFSMLYKHRAMRGAPKIFVTTCHAFRFVIKSQKKFRRGLHMESRNNRKTVSA